MKYQNKTEQAIDVIAEILDREGGSMLMAGDVLRALREDLSGGIKSKTNPLLMLFE